MFFGLILIFVGVILLLERLDVISGGLFTYWPVIIVALGISMLARRFRRNRR